MTEKKNGLSNGRRKTGRKVKILFISLTRINGERKFATMNGGIR